MLLQSALDAYHEHGLHGFSPSLFWVVLSASASLVLPILELRGREPLRRVFFLAVTAIMTAVVGARLFHVLIERPAYFAQHPLEIFTRFEGMTFYGSLALGLLSFAYLLPRTLKPQHQALAWDLTAIAGALSYGFMRLDCFFKGCCWGRISNVPWAVIYKSEDSLMPYLGLPVHPVQIYDALLGFALAALLIFLHRRRALAEGSLIYVFCVLYALGRFVTESFRGDAYRGVNLLWGLSTSQLISVGLIVVGLFAFTWRSLRSRPQWVYK